MYGLEYIPHVIIINVIYDLPWTSIKLCVCGVAGMGADVIVTHQDCHQLPFVSVSIIVQKFDQCSRLLQQINTRGSRAETLHYSVISS